MPFLHICDPLTICHLIFKQTHNFIYHAISSKRETEREREDLNNLDMHVNNVCMKGF